jgi:hypothetical protein
VLEKANMILTVSYLMGMRNSFLMCHMLLEVMHESWVENREQVICHILFKNIQKLQFLGSQLLSTSLENWLKKNLQHSTRIYKFNRIDCMLCLYFFYRMENIIFDFVSFSIITNRC